MKNTINQPNSYVKCNLKYDQNYHLICTTHANGQECYKANYQPNSKDIAIYGNCGELDYCKNIKYHGDGKYNYTACKDRIA